MDAHTEIPRQADSIRIAQRLLGVNQVLDLIDEMLHGDKQLSRKLVRKLFATIPRLTRLGRLAEMHWLCTLRASHPTSREEVEILVCQGEHLASRTLRLIQEDGYKQKRSLYTDAPDR